MAAKKPENIGFKIGADSEAVNSVGQQIMMILETNNDQKTKRAALTCLANACSVSGISISNCSVDIN